MDVMGGMFIRAEVTASEFRKRKNVNTTDNKTITVTDIYGAKFGKSVKHFN